jgi:hypothetical protein
VSENTTAYIAYDSDNLYVAFNAIDSEPKQIRAHWAPRDQAFGDDWLGFLLDTFGNKRSAYEFFSNPLGIQIDLFSDAGQEDLSPDYVWYNKGRLNNNGYVVEFKIPFKSLRFPKDKHQNWRICFIRHIPRKNEKSLWPAIYKNSGSLFLQMADLEGIEDIGGISKFQIIPEVTGLKTSPYESQKDAVHLDKWNLRSGANFKYIATPNSSIDATYSPDFSQVEADSPQITVNQRYPLFYAEKRPFFMECSHFFSFPLTIVHTRTIVDTLYGFKLTGKEGKYSGGILIANDRTRDDAVFNIFKINRDIGKESVLGAGYSAVEYKNEYNRVASIAGRFKFKKIYTLKFQGAESFTKTGLSGYKEGEAYYLSISRDAKNLGFTSSYKDLHPDFNAESGFFERVNIKTIGGEVWYKFWQDKGPFISFTPRTAYWRTYEHSGRLTDIESYLSMSLEFPLQTYLSVSYVPDNLERYEDINFTKDKWAFSLWTSPAKFLSAAFDIGIGDDINYTSSPPFLGNARSISIGLELKPISSLNINNTYLKSSLNTKSGERVFDENIYRTRILYQVNKEISTRIIYQYRTLEHDGFADVLFTYLLVPGTAFHLGYDVSFEKNGSSVDYTKEIIFTKFSYLFRL